MERGVVYNPYSYPTNINLSDSYYCTKRRALKSGAVGVNTASNLETYGH